MPIDRLDALRAVRARDGSADGRIFVGVVTTGVFCRPTCPGLVRAKDENLRFHDDAEAARHAGLRPCLRCHPEHAPRA